METFKALFSKPDPQAQLTLTVLPSALQMRKCNALLRSNQRKLDRDIISLKQVETKTKNLILAADKRAQRDPNRKKQALKDTRDFARELLRIRKQQQRLQTSKAQLSSVQMQVQEAFAMQKVQGSIKSSVLVMKEVNQLTRLPALAHTMQELSVELMKAGVIEEMVDEAIPADAEDFEEEDELAEGEVEKVLGEILKGKMEKAPTVPETKVTEEPQAAPAVEEDEEDEDELMKLRQRLDALSS
ncbi:charged multivesicular body protein 3 [Zalerion maritima]|uniref:Charged multivesicular body protein 3 n=1 Tax=Zalerion maritima TaxID=339359 RepID=A0AAD5RJ53_9PEZI|nr:charged multivesicular body protein 3 [Zalerion maritima]